MSKSSQIKRMFPGTSEELKFQLQRKKKALVQLKKTLSNPEDISRVEGFIGVIEDVLSLKYFRSGKIRNMYELNELVKNDRKKLIEELESFERDSKPELERLKQVSSDAFHKADNYLANSYEDEYLSENQEALRGAIEDYEIAQYNYDSEVWEREHKIKVFHWLLGIINNTEGFFKSVLNEE